MKKYRWTRPGHKVAELELNYESLVSVFTVYGDEGESAITTTSVTGTDCREHLEIQFCSMAKSQLAFAEHVFGMPDLCNFRN